MSVAADLDIFSLGRQALGQARASFDGRAFFTSARRLHSNGSWSGPSAAGCSLVEEGVIDALGGLPAVCEAGVNTVLADLHGTVAANALAKGLRVLVRVPFAAGDNADERSRRLRTLSELLAATPGIDGIIPVPVDEAQGLDVLAFFAACRETCGKRHLVVDLDSFGHKLGQLCLSFGADELLGPIVLQRALRLGERASSNEITRDEATLLLRASGFSPCERLPDGGIGAL
jgi:hypothetical protein